MSTFLNRPVDFKTRVPKRIPTATTTIVPEGATLRE